MSNQTHRDHLPADDQSEVLAFLARPTSYPDAAAVERVDTHAAVVFLAGDRAYKIKRAVRYDYLDFSTLERREQTCRDEVVINRRTAPELYLGVESIARRADGSLAWGAGGRIVEWVIVMRRFDQEKLLDRIAARGELDLPLMAKLAHAVAVFHEDAERIATHGGRAGMTWVVDGNAADFAKLEATLDRERWKNVTALCRDALQRHGELLDRRRRDGLVRRCHGDLHLRNIVLLDGRPTLFDAVEFNDEISCVDVLYDLAFLVMDLLRRGLPEHANAVFNRYLLDRGDFAGLPLLPFFLGCRAAIRAKTSATAAGLQSDQRAAERLGGTARDYLAMAERLLQPAPPLLIAIGGFSGSGKSTIAARLAPQVGREPGALVLRSDVIRKALFGLDEHERLGEEGYREDVTTRVYASVRERAALALSAGQAVIADAAYRNARERGAIAEVAHRAGAPFVGLWLDAPPETLAGRIQSRKADASDATPDVLQHQLAAGTGALDWHRVDAAGTLESTEKLARDVLRAYTLH